jgi:hypothetical protein
LGRAMQADEGGHWHWRKRPRLPFSAEVRFAGGSAGLLALHLCASRSCEQGSYQQCLSEPRFASLLTEFSVQQAAAEAEKAAEAEQEIEAREVGLVASGEPALAAAAGCGDAGAGRVERPGRAEAGARMPAPPPAPLLPAPPPPPPSAPAKPGGDATAAATGPGRASLETVPAGAGDRRGGGGGNKGGSGTAQTAASASAARAGRLTVVEDRELGQVGELPTLGSASSACCSRLQRLCLGIATAAAACWRRAGLVRSDPHSYPNGSPYRAPWNPPPPTSRLAAGQVARVRAVPEGLRLGGGGGCASVLVCRAGESCACTQARTALRSTPTRPPDQQPLFARARVAVTRATPARPGTASPITRTFGPRACAHVGPDMGPKAGMLGRPRAVLLSICLNLSTLPWRCLACSPSPL